MSAGIVYFLRKRQFLPFYLTQFFGAFNDNAFKLAMLTLISYRLTHNQAQSEYYQVIAGALFILPFFLFSATAGQLADKYDKSILIRIIKFFEVILMIIGSFALYYGHIWWMMLTLTGMGVHSSFFGPIKYAILPDHLPEKDLLGATGLVDASTFIAILLGTTLGTLAVGASNTSPYLAIFMTVLVAILGFICSLFIPHTQSSSPNLKVDFLFWRSTLVLLKHAAENIKILLPILIISWFWLVGSVLLTKLPDYTNYVLGANDVVFALFLSLFSIGLASGSLMVNYIFNGRIVLALVPWAMLAFSFFIFDLHSASPHIEYHANLETIATFFNALVNWRIAFDIFALAFSAGLFLVPLYTYLQVVSAPEKRAQVIAANNIYGALFMVLGSLFIMMLLHFSIIIPQIFLILSILNGVVALGAWFFFRNSCWNNVLCFQ